MNAWPGSVSQSAAAWQLFPASVYPEFLQRRRARQTIATVLDGSILRTVIAPTGRCTYRIYKNAAGRFLLSTCASATGAAVGLKMLGGHYLAVTRRYFAVLLSDA